MKITEKDVEDFSKFFNHQCNFMTPTRVSIQRKGNYIIEVSRGEGFDHNPIYGVTVLERVKGHLQRPDKDLSKCCHSIKEVDDFIKEI